MIPKDFAVVVCFLVHLSSSNYAFIGFDNLTLGWWDDKSNMKLEFFGVIDQPFKGVRIPSQRCLRADI